MKAKTNLILKFVTCLILVSIASKSFSQLVIKMTKENGVSVVPCKVNGLKLKFIFDTGASDVSISMTEASFMLKNEYLSKDDIVGTSNYLDANGNITEGVNINLREIEIGDVTLYNVKASVVNNMKAPLLLGQSAISKLGTIKLDLDQNNFTILNPEAISDSNRTNIEGGSTQITASTQSIETDNQTTLLLAQAKEAYDNQDYQGAIQKCELIIADAGNNEEALLIRAFAYGEAGEYEAAIKDYSTLIKMYPKNHFYYAFRGQMKYNKDDLNGALTDLNKAIDINNKYTYGYLWRSKTKTRQKNYALAMLDMNKAISIDPADSSLYIERALLKKDMKDYVGAIADCNKAIKIYEDFAKAYSLRGVCKEKLKNYNEALEDYDRSIALDPQISGTYAARGSLKENNLDDLDGALADYNSALEVDPKNIYASLSKSFLEEKIKNNIWIKVLTSSKGDNFYLHKSVLSKEDNEIKLWVKSDVKTFTTKKLGKSVTYTNASLLSLCFVQLSNQRVQNSFSKKLRLKGAANK